MKDSSTCPVCGAPLAQGICPACLLQAALGGNSAIPPEPDETRAARETAMAHPLTEQPGSRIGHYKLLEQIGEGGFGVVWMAEQEEPVRRRVALKIIKLGMDTREIVTRFEAERQALAMMEHPNIASVFDGGATDTGRPYFVMELVKGVPITTYCDANQLTTRERLELFLDVCHAVQHAHQKGVIHRDLKPSNILVTVQDDHAVPKIIDFGIAKATQAALTEKTLFTRLNQWIGTPEYMSPEQAGLGSLDVDTRSDIYSLGVLLYELLTGRPPFDSEKLRAAGHDAVMEVIREEEPPKPSTRLSTLAGEELIAVATRRGAEPAKLNRAVRGDLDWIVMKALEKDRRRRYETANGLADDLRRHLDNEVVLARPPGTAYRIKRFIARNRLVAGFSCALLLTLLAGTVISSWQAWRAWQSSREADNQRKIAKEEAASALRFAGESALAKEQSEANAYASRILLAAQLWQNGDAENAEKSLDECAPPLRAWEWNYLKRKFHSELLTIPPLHPNTDDVLSTWTLDRLSEASSLAFARDDTRLWITHEVPIPKEWSGYEGGFYDLSNGTLAPVQPNWLPGGATADGLRILRQAKTDSPAAIIEIASGRVLATLKAAPRTPLAPSPDGRLIASWVDDVGSDERNKRLLISSSTDGHVLWEIPWVAGGGSLLWSPDSRWLLAGRVYTHGSSGVLDVNTGQLVPTLAPPFYSNLNAAFSSDSGRLAWLGDGDNAQMINTSTTLSVWNLNTGQRLFDRVVQSTPFMVSFAQRDQTIVVAGQGLQGWPGEGGSSARNDLLLLDANSGELKRSLRLDSGLGKGPRGLSVGKYGVGPVFGVMDFSVSPDGERLAAGAIDGSVHLVEVARPERHQILRGHRSPICKVVFGAKGSRLATRDYSGEVKLWDITPSARPTLDETEDEQFRAISAYGRCVIWRENHCLQVADFDRRQRLTLPSGGSSSVSISADGRWLGDERGIWDTERRVLILHWGGEYQRLLGFSGDGRRAALEIHPQENPKAPTSARVVDTETWAPVALLLGLTWGFQLNEDGTLAALRDAKGLVQIHKLGNGPDATDILAEFPGEPPFQFAPDGSWLLTGREDGGFQQVEVRTGRVRRMFPKGSPTEDLEGFEISHCGRLAHVRRRGDGEIRDLQTGEILGKMPYPVHPGSMVFHPDGTRMAIKGPDSLLRIWDLEQRKLLTTLPVQPIAWAWSRDGSRLMVVRSDLGIEEFDGSPWKAGERKAPVVPFEDLTVARATNVPGVELVAWLGEPKIDGGKGPEVAVKPETIWHIGKQGMQLYQLPAETNANRVALVDGYGHSNPLGQIGKRSDVVKPGEYLFTTTEGYEAYRAGNPADLPQRVAIHVPKDGNWWWPVGLVVDGNLACDLVNHTEAPSETKIFDISVPESPVLRGAFSSPFHAECAYLAGKTLYLGLLPREEKSAYRVEAVDLTDPSHPVSVGQLALPGKPYELLAAGPGRLLALLGQSVVLIGISDPARMKIIGKRLPASAHSGVIMPWGEQRLLITGTAAISVAENGLKLEGWLPGSGTGNATRSGDLAMIPNENGAYLFRVRPPP